MELQGMRADLAGAILKRLQTVTQVGLEKADLRAVLDISSKLSGVLSTQWKASWKDGTSWKEKIWKQGANAERNLPVNPPDLAKLAEVIESLRREI